MEPVEEKAVGEVGLWRRVYDVISILVVIGIVGASILVSYQWLENPPRADRRRPVKRAALVEVVTAKSVSFPVKVRAMGKVVPARQITLAPRVGGEVFEVSPSLVRGGRFEADQVVASLEKEDYEIAVAQRVAELARREAEASQLEHQSAQRVADVARAEAQVDLEKARQSVALQEYELLGEDLSEEDRDFVLRKPQRASAEASLTAAKAAVKALEASRRGAASSNTLAEVALRKARLDLGRTEIRAPFNAVVTDHRVDKGAQVSPGSPIATLVCTDEYWVEVVLPLDQLRWIAVPDSPGEKGGEVRITHEGAWGEEVHRDGRVRQLLPELEPLGRMARLIVSVEDPLCLREENRGKPRLILDAYVRAEISGESIHDVVAVPRAALRDGNRVWVMDGENKLAVREVRIVWGGKDSICVRSGLNDGESIVVSDIGAPVQGMPLRLPSSVGREGGPSRPGKEKDMGGRER